MYLYYDIETVANERAREFINLHWSPPGNVTKPETIAAKKAEALETLEGCGLHWWTAKVCCICAETDDGVVFSQVSHDEKVLLEEFFHFCRELEAKGEVHYLGKNGIDFDQPILVGRAMANRLRLPYRLSGKADKTPLKDVDKIFGWSKNSQHGKLAYYAWGLGIDGKSGHGSEVQKMWNDDRKIDIKDYCMQDVNIVGKIHDIWRDCTE